jgi:hypothetical protein
MSATPLNLNESTDGMTFINQTSSSPPPPPQPPQQQQPPQQIDYSAEITKEENNINNKQNTQMDSTPLADIMPVNEVMMEPPQAQDPRMIQAAAPQVMMQPQPQAQSQTPPAQAQKQNPLNLTDEQMEALFVGVCAIIAFSKPVQDKLANFVPQFVGDDGARSTAGVAVTGLVAALVFYFGQRMVFQR